MAVAARLSTLDRFLPVWIGLAMAVGLAWAVLVGVGTTTFPLILTLIGTAFAYWIYVAREGMGRRMA